MTDCSSILADLPRLQDRRILVVGDVMLDIYDFCRSAESKPIDSEKPGKRAYSAHESVHSLGGAANVATNLACLGAQTTLLGLTGSDGHAHTLRALCEEAGIAHMLAADSKRPSTTKTRLYIDDEYILRKDYESTAPIPPDLEDELLAEITRCIDRGVDAVILSDYHKGLFTPGLTARTLEICQARGLPVVVDFKPANRALFRQAGLLVPNESEADALMPGFKNCTDLPAALAALQAELNATAVVVTLGARGICGLCPDTGYFHHAGHAVDVVDAVGCGDTVRAMLALGLAAGLDLNRSAALANHAAAVIVQKPATATLTQAELEAFIRHRQNPA